MDAFPFFSFDLQLEEFGVNIAEFSEPVWQHVYKTWLDNWENPLLKNNDHVGEERWWVRHQRLVVFDPDK